MTVVDMSPDRWDWTFPRGDTWRLWFQFTEPTTAQPVTGEPIDLTGSEWLCQIRVGSQTGPVWTVVPIATGGHAQGIISGSVSPTATTGAALGSAYVYDVQQTLDGEVVTPVWGKIKVWADVTKDEP